MRSSGRLHLELLVAAGRLPDVLSEPRLDVRPARQHQLRIHLREHRQDLHWFLRQLEAALIGALGQLGIEAERNEGYTGVWTSGRKIASIGIHVKQWVTWHGFALNVTTDLSFFDLIVPCGIPGVVMTSVRRELGERAPRDLWARTIDQVVLGFAETFGQSAQAGSLEDLPDTSSH